MNMQQKYNFTHHPAYFSYILEYEAHEGDEQKDKIMDYSGAEGNDDLKFIKIKIGVLTNMLYFNY